MIEELRNTFGAQLTVDYGLANGRISRLYIDQDPAPPETLYGIVQLEVDIGYIPRELKPQGMAHWGDWDYRLDDDDLTTDWKILDDFIFSGTFYSYSETELGEDPETGTLKFTLPDGIIQAVDVRIDPHRSNISTTMTGTISDRGCAYDLEPLRGDTK